MDFAQLCKKRYSVRKFSTKPVEEEKLNAILQAGISAPTAKNLQPQRFFLITSKEGLAKADACMASHFAPPAIIMVAYDPKEAWVREEDGKNHGEIDATIAVTQMMLQAAELGLGTTYVGMFSVDGLHKAFPELNGLIPTAMLPLGYPADDAHPSHLHESRKTLQEIAKRI